MLAVLLAGVATASARPTLTWKQVAEHANWVGGTDTLAWIDASGRNVVGRTPSGATVAAIPPDCSEARLLTAGSGYALLRCPPFDDHNDHFCAVEHLRVLSLASGAVQPFTTSEPIGCADAEPDWGWIGRDWIEGWNFGHEDISHVFVNWHTGETFTDRDDNFGADHYLDLSSPQLGRPLCAGVRRVAQDGDPMFGMPAYDVVDVHGRWVVQGVGTKGGTAVHDCGQRGRVRFRLPAWPQLSGNTMLWHDPGQAPPYQRYLAMRLPAGRREVLNPPHRDLGLILLGRSVYSVTIDGYVGDRVWGRIYRARLPRELR